MTFLQLFEEVSNFAFPEGRAENLESVHRSMVVEALYELQKWVPCYQENNTDTYPHCAGYFSCGLTVLPKPVGQIISLYVIDRVNPDTGLEDPTASEDWCTKVHYTQVEYCQIQNYRRVCERCSSTGIIAAAEALVAGFFGIWRRKSAYPKPDDAGLEEQPVLPMGFHYPQTSTDAQGRSPSGVWAIHRGRIYIAPWIQSTETVVIEWNGIKRNWADSDLVEDDPKFKQAVRLSLLHAHEQAYGDNPAKTQQLQASLRGSSDDVGVLPMLMDECREQNRIKRCGEAGMANLSGAARGIGTNTTPINTYKNDQQYVVTEDCPAGTHGNSKTVIVKIDTVGSPFSVADANAKAYQQALDDAAALLVCADDVTGGGGGGGGTGGTVFTNSNAGEHVTASCPASYTNSAGNEVPAAEGDVIDEAIGTYTSTTLSGQALDDWARSEAQKRVDAERKCTFWNAYQSTVAHCASPSVETYTGEVQAHVKSVANQAPAQFATAQVSADKQAKDAATQLANAGLPAACKAALFRNTKQTTPNPYCATIYWTPNPTPGHPNPIPMSCPFCLVAFYGVAPANLWTGATQALANTAAMNAAIVEAQQAAFWASGTFPTCPPQSTQFVYAPAPPQ